jgi:rhamnosyltransferase
VAVGKASDQTVRPSEVAALIITYCPDGGLTERIDALLAQFGRLHVVDNGSDQAALAPLSQYDQRVTLQRNGSNVGIATALNQGLRTLGAEGFEWVVTFDQDSSVRSNFIASMLETLNAAPDRETVALIGANRIDPDNPVAHKWLRPRRGFPFFERVTCQKAAAGVTLVITSGALTRVAVFEALGGFRDQLFIDLVDYEFCLRARERGYRILVCCGAQLLHKVGNRTTSTAMGLPVSATHHSPLRKYYLFRNSIPVMKSHGRLQPHWLVHHLLSLGEVILGILLWETGKAGKLKACGLGIFDGLCGVSGPSARTLSESRPASASR